MTSKGFPFDLGRIMDEAFQFAQNIGETIDRETSEKMRRTAEGFGSGLFGNTDYYPTYLYPPATIYLTRDKKMVFEFALALMREHVLPTARLHRQIKDGGLAANIIPDYARVQWFVRDETGPRVAEMLGRIRKAADGAALATETKAKVTVLASTREPIYNDALSRVVQKQLERVGPPAWDAADVALAKAIQKEVGIPEAGLADAVVPFGPGHGDTASSDVGETSAALPLAELSVAAGPAGSPWHHWAVTSCSANAIGRKGMFVAEKVLAASLVDLLTQPATVAAAKAEFMKSTEGKPWVSPFPPDATPKVY